MGVHFSILDQTKDKKNVCVNILLNYYLTKKKPTEYTRSFLSNILIRIYIPAHKYSCMGPAQHSQSPNLGQDLAYGQS